MNEKPQHRLSMREEGAFWVAYMAKANTMVGAIPLGTIRKSIVEHNAALKLIFMRLMEEAFKASYKEMTGDYVEFNQSPVEAPANERVTKA